MSRLKYLQAKQKATIADNLFQIALEERYGSNAGDMRYHTKELPPAIKLLALKYQEAAEEFRLTPCC